VEEKRPPGRRRGPFSPQEILLSPGETGLKGPRNPPQKALVHKEVRNIKTPPEVLSHPPQGYMPPFYTREEERRVPWFKAGLSIYCSETGRKCRLCIQSFNILEKHPILKTVNFYHFVKNRWLA